MWAVLNSYKHQWWHKAHMWQRGIVSIYWEWFVSHIRSADSPSGQWASMRRNTRRKKIQICMYYDGRLQFELFFIKLSFIVHQWPRLWNCKCVNNSCALRLHGQWTFVSHKPNGRLRSESGLKTVECSLYQIHSLEKQKQKNFSMFLSLVCSLQNFRQWK